LEDKKRPRSDGGWRTCPADGRGEAAPAWASTDDDLCTRRPLQIQMEADPRIADEESWRINDIFFIDFY
jgi:hypothetical protein